MMQYQLLDSGNKQKLEQVGPYRIIRPALNAFWAPTLSRKEWDLAVATFDRINSSGGDWHNRSALPEKWQIKWGNFTLTVKPTNFGHLGFFAEQYRNWAWFEEIIPSLGTEVKALNLFAYSGVGSMAMAAGGAKVTHLDASKGMIEWGQENLPLNPRVPGNIRWIVDDVNKFCARDQRRNSRYQVIALDPPSFGRGSKGQVWKIEEDLIPLLECCKTLIEPDKKFCVVLSCHSPGFSELVLERLLLQVWPGCRVEATEMTIPESTGKYLPAGISARLTNF